MNFDKYKIRQSPGGEIDTNEVFLDALAQQKEQEFGFSEKKFEVAIKSKIILLFFGLFFIGTSILFARSWYLQVLNGKKYSAMAEGNKGAIGLIRPERGIIYDANMQKLVLNAPAYDLVCTKPTSDELKSISTILKQSVETPSTDSKGQTVVAQDINQEALLVLEAREQEFPDCAVEKNTVRNYAMGSIFSHVLGYEGRINQNELKQSPQYAINDYIGKTGLENYYESILRGTPGRFVNQTTASGTQKEKTVFEQPKDGNNLVLNIDAGLQETIYKSLEQQLHNIGAKKGAAVALDPNTGAVLAMVSYPSYDDNVFSGGISQKDFSSLINDPTNPLFNRAIGAKYPTGSVIKPLVAAAALQENLISPTKQLYDPGYILVPSQNDPSVVYKFGGVKPHGWVDMRAAIAVSSNIYFYTVGGGYGDQNGLGPTRIKTYLSKFGWSNATGVDLPGEFSGFIPDPAWKQKTKGQPWFNGDTYNLAIGQSDLETTPLQVANAYAAIANGGTLYKPQIVKKIVDTSSGSVETVQEFKPEVTAKNIIDPQNLEIVREGMRDGVTKPYGLSGILNNLPVSVAAKTGTAEIGYKNKFNLWSAAFAPYDHPQIVIVVTAEEVNALGAVTLPVSRDALKYFFSDKK